MGWTRRQPNATLGVALIALGLFLAPVAHISCVLVAFAQDLWQQDLEAGLEAHRLGNYIGARHKLENAAARLESTDVASEKLPALLLPLGTVYTALGQSSDATRAFYRALPATEPIYGHDP